MRATDIIKQCFAISANNKNELLLIQKNYIFKSKNNN